jgi:MFS transporter, BCD family, chlorophyll transporter
MLTWAQIIRLGVVQMCLGAIVVITTSTLNRLMVVEMGLPAVLAGALVALHYGIQITRPQWGFRSDAGGNRTRFIIGGMVVLAIGGFLAAWAVTLFAGSFWMGITLSVLAYTLIGLGVGASGTSLLALLATSTHPQRRAAAASITWLMMIAGIALTAGGLGHFLQPYSPALLLQLVGMICAGAVVVTTLAVWGIEARMTAVVQTEARMSFRAGLAEVWGERRARNFTIFVLLSMTAYFMQDLILEPFAGLAFYMTPAQTTSLSGAQTGGAFFGMLAVGIVATGFKIGSLRAWVIAGCVGSACALTLIAFTAQIGSVLLTPAVVMLGLCNGMFAVAAIGSMMAMAGQGRAGREGTRMGLWGAAQAVAAGFGGLIGSGAADVLRLFVPAPQAYGAVFLCEAALFLCAAVMALRILDTRPQSTLIAGE